MSSSWTQKTEVDNRQSLFIYLCPFIIPIKALMQVEPFVADADEAEPSFSFGVIGLAERTAEDDVYNNIHIGDVDLTVAIHISTAL